jgi:hypothetical protein
MPGRTPRRPWITFALALFVAFQTATPAWAWGRLGHRVISRLAEKQMTPAAKAAVAELLEPGESLANGSLWADEHRRELPRTAPWHYVDVPLDEPKYDSKWSADDPKKGCVVDKINEFRLAIKDMSKTIEERRFALRFLIHCVEDMHMPMHVGDNKDKGGNNTQVRFFDKGTNLHRLWDSDMIEWTGDGEDFGGRGSCEVGRFWLRPRVPAAHLGRCRAPRRPARRKSRAAHRAATGGSGGSGSAA